MTLWVNSTKLYFPIFTVNLSVSYILKKMHFYKMTKLNSKKGKNYFLKKTKSLVVWLLFLLITFYFRRFCSEWGRDLRGPLVQSQLELLRRPGQEVLLHLAGTTGTPIWRWRTDGQGNIWNKENDVLHVRMVFQWRHTKIFIIFYFITLVMSHFEVALLLNSFIWACTWCSGMPITEKKLYRYTRNNWDSLNKLILGWYL